MWRLWLIVAWFVSVILWSLPPGWTVGAEIDRPRLLMAALGAMATPTTITLTIAVIVLILTVNLQPRAPF